MYVEWEDMSSSSDPRQVVGEKLVVFIPSRSKKGKMRRVVQLESGAWLCPCEDFVNRGHIRPCWHIRLARRRGRDPDTVRVLGAVL